MGSGNWIVDNLNSALEMWNGRLAEIWQLISTSPESFKGGGVWNVIVNINDGLKAVGYALLVLFFVMGVVKTCGSFTEMKKAGGGLQMLHPLCAGAGGSDLGHGVDDWRVSRCPGHGGDHHGFLRTDSHVCHHIAGRTGECHRGCGLY